MTENIAKLAIETGGSIHPLIIPNSLTGGTGLCNPSILVDGDRILVNVRHVQYTIYHSEKDQKFPSWYGPLIYLHPEDDLTLRTENYLCELNNDLSIKTIDKVEMLQLHQPSWTFIGLEDARLIKWNNKVYLTGVRRDTTTNGEGRMELSELDGHKEVNRTRIHPPDHSSYCEKNWMPILDRPFCYVKWTNPTEVVRVEGEQAWTESTEKSLIPFPRDIRGGSQLIPYANGYLAVTHEVDLWNGEGGHKDAQYYHRFVLWDHKLQVIGASREFKFMDARIEFCCGLAEKGDDLLITFGYQDNTAFLLRIPKETVNTFIHG